MTGWDVAAQGHLNARLKGSSLASDNRFHPPLEVTQSGMHQDQRSKREHRPRQRIHRDLAATRQRHRPAFHRNRTQRGRQFDHPHQRSRHPEHQPSRDQPGRRSAVEGGRALRRTHRSTSIASAKHERTDARDHAQRDEMHENAALLVELRERHRSALSAKAASRHAFSPRFWPATARNKF